MILLYQRIFVSTVVSLTHTSDAFEYYFFHFAYFLVNPGMQRVGIRNFYYILKTCMVMKKNELLNVQAKSFMMFVEEKWQEIFSVIDLFYTEYTENERAE